MTSEVSTQDQWRMLVVEGKAPLNRQRLSRLYALLPANSRCRMCKVPFAGVSGQVMRVFGKAPSNINPHLCNNCDVFFRTNPGGVEIPLSMLFADIRGSTSLAEHMRPSEFREMISRFYATATNILSNSFAMIDKLAGDQVSGYYLPGLVGPGHSRKAVLAAQDLLKATGHGEPGGPWVPVGVGVHTGNAFYGSVGSQGGVMDITALGDAVNIAARLASNAGPGEILVSQETFAETGLDREGRERRQLVLKGRSQPVSVIVL